MGDVESQKGTSLEGSHGPVDSNHGLGPDEIHSHAHLSSLEPQHHGTPPEVNDRPFSIYLGSFASAYQPRSSLPSLRPGTPRRAPSTPRDSADEVQLERLLHGTHQDLNSYGVDEKRDGLFDATFLPYKGDDEDSLLQAAHLGYAPFAKGEIVISPLEQLKGVARLCRRVVTTRAGIKLLKTFLGFFTAYILCLAPRSKEWLGPYNYIAVISAIINHPGRTVGAQVDGLVLTILGTTAGLGWGSLALWSSTATQTAQAGYGGVLAGYLIVFTALIAWLRCVFIRLYIASIAAGIAIAYTCLADTSETVGWQKIFNYGVPWVIGQGASLVVCLVVFPDAGSRPIAVALHDALDSISTALQPPHPSSSSTRRLLSWNFSNLSLSARDFTIDIAVCRFRPDDVRDLRNHLQRVIRAVLAIKGDGGLLGQGTLVSRISDESKESSTVRSRRGRHNTGPGHQRNPDEIMNLVGSSLAVPTRELLDMCIETIASCQAVLMDIAGYRRYLGPSPKVSSDMSMALERLQRSMSAFDGADSALIHHPLLSSSFHTHPEVVEIFLFVHASRQAADAVKALAIRVRLLQEKRQGWRFSLPSYPFPKALDRTNAQVRHDRGGLTAAVFFKSKSELEKTMRELQSSIYNPAPKESGLTFGQSFLHDKIKSRDSDAKEVVECEGRGQEKLRYRIWTALHRFQGFEARFALKITILVLALSVPAWVEQSRGWWNADEIWWVVVTVWLMMHPRVSSISSSFSSLRTNGRGQVGGNLQDLFTRAFCVVLGATFGGLAYVAGNGNAFVIGTFALFFMMAMLYRYTQSAHPRSGLVGCISFTVISLSAYDAADDPSPFHIAWTRGSAMVVGVVAAVVLNWILWPFVARHELRKSISTMMLHAAILYRGVIGKYIYYEDGNEPTKADIERSEMLEGRLREGLVRIRQLMHLTRHEMRLRAPFNPLPYSALIDAVEILFEHLIEVRQSSLYFQSYMHAGKLNETCKCALSPTILMGRIANTAATEALMTRRRDAVASILMTLYVLAGALRSGRPVPAYLPSAAAARKMLLQRMAEVEAEIGGAPGEQWPQQAEQRRWADVYHYAYSTNLTDIVVQLEHLSSYTRLICGTFGFDVPYDAD
ncbi:MAG: hypothetical protein M1825_004273 [Sarcosagium campestre]|nr:MAG: hypothetical protein M1825_004273 [Sarcosagium campestre]